MAVRIGILLGTRVGILLGLRAGRGQHAAPLRRPKVQRVYVPGVLGTRPVGRAIDGGSVQLQLATCRVGLCALEDRPHGDRVPARPHDKAELARAHARAHGVDGSVRHRVAAEREGGRPRCAARVHGDGGLLLLGHGDDGRPVRRPTLRGLRAPRGRPRDGGSSWPRLCATFSGRGGIAISISISISGRRAVEPSPPLRVSPPPRTVALVRTEADAARVTADAATCGADGSGLHQVDERAAVQRRCRLVPPLAAAGTRVGARVGTRVGARAGARLTPSGRARDASEVA